MMRLRYLFVDMNSYFASVEQQDRPALRGRPLAVVPTQAETTCCIAASYEAKRFGVRTGTQVRDARRLCPAIVLVEARPVLYVHFHRRIVAAVESCLHVDHVMSIDEMVCRLLGEEQLWENALRLGKKVKATIRDQVGDSLACSVGIGPNIMLAKVAADMQKPDGLTLLRGDELRERLNTLRISDFPGIGPGMERRLREAGVTSVAQICRLSPEDWSHICKSKIVGWRWWRLLRGEDVPLPTTRRQSVGHSRVLPPRLRNDADARAVLIHLTHQAAARMRALDYHARAVAISVAFLEQPSWSAHQNLESCGDTPTLLRIVAALWQQKPPGRLLKVGVVLGKLIPCRDASLSLFPEDRRRLSLSKIMDQVNRRYGPCAVYFAGMFGAEAEAPMRIAFDKIPAI